MSAQNTQILHLIDGFKKSTPYIEGISIVSTEGLTICSNLRYSEEERVAAIAATLVSLGMNTTTSLGKGNLNSVFVKGENGYILLGEINQSIVITVVTRSDVKIGVVLWELEKVKQKLLELFRSDSF